MPRLHSCISRAQRHSLVGRTNCTRIQIPMTLLTILLFIPHTFALFGYDCSIGHPSTHQLSINSVGNCNIKDKVVNTTETYLQLLQLTKFSNTHVISCQVQILRDIFYCGRWSHISKVKGGFATHIKELSREECLKLHETGRITIGNALIDKVPRNATMNFAVTLAGSLNSDGDCNGVNYADPYGEWENVVVQADIKITLLDFHAQVLLEENSLVTPRGVRCPLSRGSCKDFTGASLFWETFPKDSCDFDKYTVLYEGPGTRMYEANETSTSTMIAVTSNDITFALNVYSNFNLCGYYVQKSEHPRLFIIERQKGTFFKKASKVNTNDLDLFNYVNSKFIYVEKHIKQQFETLYKDILTKRCELEKKVLEQSLSLVSISPDEFALNYMKEPGYTAIVTGETVQMIKCVAIKLKLAPETRCYQELPVVNDNRTFFLSPRTKILRKRGVEVTCNAIMPPTFEIDGKWYKLTPKPIEVAPPEILQPDQKASWTYISPQRIGSAGIYSEEDLQRLRDFLTLPGEQAAIVNIFTRAATGREFLPQDVNFGQIIDENTLKKLVDNTWNRIWDVFSGFGATSAGLIGIYFVVRLIKLMIDTAIHLFALHSVYGWSLYLVGAVWDSITHLLLHLKKTAPTVPDVEQGETNLEMQQPNYPAPRPPDVPRRNVTPNNN